MKFLRDKMNREYCLRILELSDRATEDEIKSSYRRLALKWHPDRNSHSQESEQKFREVEEAYAILTGKQQPQQQQHFQGDWTQHFAQNFANMFHGGFNPDGNPHSSLQKGENIFVEVILTLKEVRDGTKRNIKITRDKICSSCNGKGAKTLKKCGNCNGSGTARRNLGPFSINLGCDVCFGTGETTKDVCEDCKGAKYLGKEDKVFDDVVIPKGFNEQIEMKISQQGQQFHNGNHGDVVLKIKVEDHPNLKRITPQNLKTVVTLPITYFFLGGECEVEGIDGEKFTIEIKAGTHPGHSYNIQNAGLPHYTVQNGSRGILQVEARADVKPVFDLAKDLFEKLKVIGH